MNLIKKLIKMKKMILMKKLKFYLIKLKKLIKILIN